MKPEKLVPKPSKPVRDRPSSPRSLRVRLEEAEQALAAIGAGEVDTLVVAGDAGDRVFTLDGADRGYRVLMDAMSEGVATVTEQGLISYCNARFTEIVGARPELTIGNPVLRFVPPADHERFQALMAAGDAGRSEDEFWLKAPCAEVPALVRLAVVALTQEGTPMHCLVMTDLTEHRRLTAAMDTERAQMQTRLLLADRMSSLGTLASGVAHEINNPLAYVIASLELISKRLPELAAPSRTLGSEPTEWLRRQLERAQGGAERVRLIVRGLQAFTQADDESLGVIDPRRALDTSITMVSSEIRHRAQFVSDYETLPSVRANESRLGQVFLNLLVNATQAIPVGAAGRNEIRVTGRTDDEGRAVIEVRDTGSGIAADHLPLVFDPFFTTQAPNMGTGLGLALCHAIITSLGGQITVESTPGVGSVFRVVLPGVPAVVPAAKPPTLEPPAPERRGRMLVIDDEEDTCDVMREALASSHDVVTASNARRALELLAGGEVFDLILCDVRMPEMTGLDFYRVLAVDNPGQAARVILMSGGFTRRAGEAATVFPRPVLEKPFELEQLLTLMRDAVKANGPGSAA